MNDGCDISSEIALRWTSLDLSDDKSTLVQVMAWCRQATSHYLGQCWPRSLSPYGVNRPQWVNKGIGFLYGLKLFALNIFCKEYLQPSLCLMLQICFKKSTGKDVQINNYEFLNIHTCSFNLFWNRDCTHSLLMSCKFWVVLLIH